MPSKQYIAGDAFKYRKVIFFCEIYAILCNKAFSIDICKKKTISCI